MCAFKDSLQALNQEYDICVFGEGKIGISSFVYSYIHERYPERVEPGLEQMYTKWIWDEDRYNEVTIMGISATEDNYLESRKQYVRNTRTAILAYSITDRHSFENLEHLFSRMLLMRKDELPFIVVGLKSDLEVERQVSLDEGKEMADALGALYFQECSAKQAIGVNEAFETIIQCALKVRETTEALKIQTGLARNSKMYLQDAIEMPAIEVPMIEVELPATKTPTKEASVNEPPATEPTSSFLSDEILPTKHKETSANASQSNHSTNRSLQSEKLSEDSSATLHSVTQQTRSQNYSKAANGRTIHKEKSGCCIIM